MLQVQISEHIKATMAGGPPTPQLSPVHPLLFEPDALSAHPEQLLVPPVQQVQDPVQPAQVQVQPGQLPLNWSYFKPEFSDKPGEDAEAYLLRRNNWMETHKIPDVAKVQ